jgi:hypothetical protein
VPSYADSGGDSLSHCTSALTSTRRICRGTTIAIEIMVALKAYESFRRTENIREACQEAQQISQISYAGNSIYALNCERSIRHCKRACKDENEIALCEDFEDQVKLATVQAISNAQTISGSKACATATLDKCANDTCLQNTSSPLPEYINSDIIPEPRNDNLELKDDKSVSDYDFKPKELSNNKSHVNISKKNSLGFEVGSEKSFPIDSPQGISNPDSIEKDILRGTNSVSSGTTLGYSNNVEETYTPNLNKKNANINLKDFLPGGPKYQHNMRNTHGNPELTPANGLSNFQKITRKINEKRSELIP